MKAIKTVTAASITALAAACGGDGTATSTTGGGGSGGATTQATSSSSSSSSSGAGAMGGAGGAGGMGCVDTGPVSATFVPTPADIQFSAASLLPHGEQILFNDWNPSPNTLSSMTPDGLAVTKVFSAYRLWSFGVSHAGDTIAFACGDPQQEAHYQGLNLGDAIQHTWLFDAASQAATLLADGNVNDECHAFAPGDATLYVCRRYDFTNCFADKGYRLGALDLATKAFTFLSPEDPSTMALNPQPTPDGASLVFAEIQATSGGFVRTIQEMDLPAGTPSLVRDAAGFPGLSPDGTRYVYADYTDGGKLWVSTLDGSAKQRIAPQGDSAAWSPDGASVAYLAADTSVSCNHVDVVKADGSTATAPVRVRDCTKTNEFITELAWIVRP